MFLGEYHHQLDDKGRIRIPPKFREQLGEGAMMMVGFEKCLMLYTSEDFEKRVYNRLADTDFLNLGAADIKRVLFSKTQPIEEDKQGRVTVNPIFLAACGIKKNIVTIGALDHAEIWDEDAFKAHMEEIDIKTVLAPFNS
ncbi:MAG: division/cell wall cluster transcriptional repressor MraZ [Clostridiales bacterium]|nr:division/cell wall cluster transcriptional repressor MraZ [Clostridiales bacterium]